MKTIIVTMPMFPVGNLKPVKYPVYENKELEYDGEVAYPVNSVLAKTLKNGEKARIIFLVTIGGENQGGEHIKNFKAELDNINQSIGAAFEYIPIEFPFEPTQKEFDKLIRTLIEKIGDDAEVIMDFTYGSKPFPFILLCALNFAEMFHNAAIQYIVYGKVEFIEGAPSKPALFDITSIYYLQKLIGKMEGRGPEQALEMLDSFSDV